MYKYLQNYVIFSNEAIVGLILHHWFPNWKEIIPRGLYAILRGVTWNQNHDIVLYYEQSLQNNEGSET